MPVNGANFLGHNNKEATGVLAPLVLLSSLDNNNQGAGRDRLSISHSYWIHCINPISQVIAPFIPALLSESVLLLTRDGQ